MIMAIYWLYRVIYWLPMTCKMDKIIVLVDKSIRKVTGHNFWPIVNIYYNNIQLNIAFSFRYYLWYPICYKLSFYLIIVIFFNPINNLLKFIDD